MITLNISSAPEPEIIEINQALIKYNLKALFGLELLSAEYVEPIGDENDGHLKISFDEKITTKLLELISASLLMNPGSPGDFNNTAKGWQGRRQEQGRGRQRGRQRGRGQRCEDDKSGKVNSYSFRVGDGDGDVDAYGVCTLYMEPELKHLWKEKSDCFYKFFQKGLTNYGMTFEDYKGGDDGTIQFKVHGLVGVPIFKAFQGMKNFTKAQYTKQCVKDGVGSAELKKFSLWQEPAKWSLIIYYSDGTERKAIWYE